MARRRDLGAKHAPTIEESSCSNTPLSISIEEASENAVIRELLCPYFNEVKR